MVKERKIQSGATNISARDGTLHKLGDFHRSPSHKLIAPGVYKPPTNNELVRDISITAVWKKDCKPVDSDFHTVHTDSFRDPSTIPPRHFKIKSLAETEAEVVQVKRQDQAMDKFLRMSKKVYGTTAGMFKQFKKMQGDDLNKFELGEYLKRAKAESGDTDTAFTDDDVSVLFETINPKNKGSIPVTAFLKKAEEVEFKEVPGNKDMLEMRDFLLLKVAKQREKISGQKLSEIEQLQQVKCVEDESELMKLAIGSKPFDLEVTNAELEEALQEVHAEHTDHEVDSKTHQFSRHLRNGNINLHRIPFYDMRMEELEKTKKKAAIIHHTLDQPEYLQRLAELEQTRWRPSLSTLQYEERVPTGAHEHFWDEVSHEYTESEDGIKAGIGSYIVAAEDVGGKGEHSDITFQQKQYGSGSMNQSLSLPALSPTVSARGSPLRISTNNGQSNGNSVRSGASTGSRRTLPPFSPSGTDGRDSGVDRGPYSAPGKMSGGNNGTTKNSNSNNNNNSSSFSGTARSTSNDSMISRVTETVQSRSRGKPSCTSRQTTSSGSSAILDDLIYAERVEEASVNTSLAAKKSNSKRSTMFLKRGEIKVVGPTSLLSGENDSTADLNSSMDSMDSMDSMGSIGSSATGYRPPVKFNKSFSNVTIGSGVEDNERFVSTQKKFYPPIIYEPSKAPRRDLISEAEMDHKKREYKRSERRARKNANLDVTQTRVEYEELDKTIRDMRRSEAKIGKRIRYQTAIILDDLRQYKQQPLERMARKPNIKSADTMWGGHQERHTAKVVPELRDFLTTYSASFEGSQG